MGRYGAVEFPEWDAKGHGPIQLGSRAEEMAIIGIGGEGVQHQVFQRIWEPPGDGDLLQIPGVGNLVNRRQLAGSGEELVPGKEGLE